jgi:hypothetical protein
MHKGLQAVTGEAKAAVQGAVKTTKLVIAPAVVTIKRGVDVAKKAAHAAKKSTAKVQHAA